MYIQHYNYCIRTFSYLEEVIDTIMLLVDIYRDGYTYDWMYFKAGLYSQNKSVKDEDDYEQVTFYALENKH